MTILAIDPGSEQSAYLSWDGEKIGRRGIVPNAELIDILYQVDEEEHCVCEMVQCFGMPAGATLFETCFVSGRFCEAWNSHHPGTFSRIYRKDIKLHLCHSARAKDPNVRQVLIDRFGPPGIKKNKGLTYGISKDLWSAFAVAVTWWDQHGEGK